MFGKRSKSNQPEPTPATPACSCPSVTTWTEQQAKAFGPMPIKFADCPLHD
jgi:hypothetical protein